MELERPAALVLPGFLKGLSPRFGATRGTRVGGATISVCPYLGDHGVGVIQEIWDTEVHGRRATSLGVWVRVRWLGIWCCEDDGERIGRQPWGGGSCLAVLKAWKMWFGKGMRGEPVGFLGYRGAWGWCVLGLADCLGSHMEGEWGVSEWQSPS